MEEQNYFTEKFKGRLPQLYAALAASLIGIPDGMTIGWTAPMIPYLISEESHIKATRHEAESLETAFLLGIFLGLPVTVAISERLGRRRSLLVAIFLVTIAWISILVADRIMYIYAARFLSGVGGNMAFVIGPMYLAEISDQTIRGFLSSLLYIMVLTGCLIMYCVGPYLPYYGSPLIAGIISIIEFAIFYFMPESPYYLLYKNKFKKAKTSLEFLRPDGDVYKELQEMSDAIERQKLERGSVKDFFLVKSNRKALIIMIILNAGQHLSAIHVILMNLHLIVRDTGSIYLKDSTTGIIFSIIMLVSAVIASFQVDKYGRKMLLIISSIMSGLCLLTIAIYFNVKNAGYETASLSWLPIVAVMAYAASFKMGLGLVPVIIIAELFSAKMKSMGMTAAEAMYAAFSIITIQIYLHISSSFGIHVPFYLFSICAFLVTIFAIYYIPETKGKTLEEIQFILIGGKPNEQNKDASVNANEIPLMTQNA